MDNNQGAELLWRDGVPVSTRFDDPYYSLEDGLEEARHVFLAGNDLAVRLRPGFHIAELGFGTGLNFLATCALWRELGREGRFRFTSFEAHPISKEAMTQALVRFPTLDARDLIHAWPCTQLTTAEAELKIVFGDARDTLPQWAGAADAWFLDGFAPTQNPELWEPSLMQAVARHTRPGGGFATYTAAGAVRRALSEAGFAVDRRPGYGRKRHMTVGRLG